ncbi:divalent-cation tolerance protein CutA [Oscillatoria laete-virens NRMC-F 0139]|nr:divalent-cation tolerance protein CutA [Oscillatoria laete-virens]MDL5054701.1 divalent-cation tolerance protein CutA [Oscillatoria laete-virens NRMC-F 0139]
MKYCLLYIPCKTKAEARKIGENLVRARLAACANIPPGPMESVYEWKGVLRREKEFLLLVKTRRSLIKKVEAAVGKWHSYECPCIVAFDLATANAGFLDWLGAQTQG